MSDKEKLIVRTGIHPKLVSRLLTFGIGLAAIVSLVAIGVVGGVNTVTVQQAYAQENSNACPEGYTKNRGLCIAEPFPGEGGCPVGSTELSIGWKEYCGLLGGGFSTVRDKCPTIVNEARKMIQAFVPDDPTNPLGPGFCQFYQIVNPLPSSEPSCPDTNNFREPEIVNGQCQVRPGEGEPEPGDDEEVEVEEEEEEEEEEVEGDQ